MFTHCRRIGAVLIVAVFLAGAPSALAGPHSNRDGDVFSRLVRIIQKFQKFFGATAQAEYPVPPRP